MHTPAPEQFLTRKEAAKILGISLPTLRSLSLTGKLKQYKLGNKIIRYKAHELGSALE
jgi:excisionase family DNA binding protein